MRPGILINIPEKISGRFTEDKVPFCIFKEAQSFSNFIGIYQEPLLKISISSYHDIIY